MKKMKLIIGVFSVLFFVSSCSDSHTDDGCHECHLALDNPDGGEWMWEITNPWDGGDEFCGSGLTTVEDPSYVYTVTDTLYEFNTNIPLLPGDYGASNGYEIHCEDHGDHDH